MTTRKFLVAGLLVTAATLPARAQDYQPTDEDWLAAARLQTLQPKIERAPGYDECMLDKMRGQPDYMVESAVRVCLDKFPAVVTYPK